MTGDYGELVEAFKRRLPQDQLEELGRTTGFVQRLRRILPSFFVLSVVLSRFGTGRPAFERARHWFARLSGNTLFPRPFQMRRPRVRHVLGKHFPDVVVWDASLLKLDAGLRVRSDHKLDLPTELLRKGTLVLFDKGFVAYDRLRRLEQASLKFLCPMRIHAHARITKVRSGPARVRKALKQNPSGVELRDLLPKNKRISKVWDVDVEVRPTARDADCSAVAMRLTIVPGPKGEQRPYLTNLDPKWSPPALRELYRLRWQIELVFKELKQHLNLETVPTKDPHAAQVLIWASLIALAVSRTIASVLGPILTIPGAAAPIRPSVVTRELRSVIRPIAFALFARSKQMGRDLERIVIGILQDAVQPNVKRRDSFAALAMLAPSAPA